jgi:DNA invertase Pin-like site-specific DNA recombinase
VKKAPNYAVDAHYPLEVQQMMADTKQCLSCGKMLGYNQRKEGRRNRGYCSYSHYRALPPKMAYAEKEYGQSAKEVILEILNNGATVTATAERLGIGKSQFYKWMDKFSIKKKVVWG